MSKQRIDWTRKRKLGRPPSPGGARDQQWKARLNAGEIAEVEALRKRLGNPSKANMLLTLTRGYKV